jgi:hypothetical protein
MQQLPLLEEQNSVSSNFYWILFFAVLIVKFYLATIFPITCDEAEYIYFAKHLSLGLYDHPPMIGWILVPLIKFGFANAWLRLPQSLSSSLIALAIYGGLKKFDAEKAIWISLLYLLSPVSILNQTILTDTPLIIFTFFAVFCLFLGINKNRYFYFILAGIFWGAAFWSKYLMLPAALFSFLFLLGTKNIENKGKKLLLLAIFASPFILQNLWWNYHHDWVNFAFNLNLRNQENFSFDFWKPLFFLFTQLIIFSPIFFLYAGKNVIKTLKNVHHSASGIFSVVFWGSFFFFALLSLTKKIGFHWTFATYPFLFVAIFDFAKIKALKIQTWLMGIYSLFLAVATVLLVSIPISYWQKYPKVFPDLNWFLHYHEVEKDLNPYLAHGFVLASKSYGQSYLLSYRSQNEAIVWGEGSVHGRQDDLTTDFKTLDKKNILIFNPDQDCALKTIKPYFSHTKALTFQLNRMPYCVVLGYQFNYPKYRDVIIRKIFNDYYQLPTWILRAEHWFQNKYFKM